MRLFHTWFTWIMLGLAFIGSYFFASMDMHIFLSKLFSNILFFMAGIVGLWAAMGHLLAPERTAESIGWKSSPFQTEMGFTNLSLGVAGLIAPWQSLSYQLCLTLILSILWYGCAYVHIKDRFKSKNCATHNSGPMLYTTILTPLLLWGLYFLQ